jgi:hypothetical protein
MSEVYVVRNQLGHYWGKGKIWADGTEPKAVMQLKHEDEAINTLFELSSKDIELRGELLKVALTEKGAPVIEPSEHLIPKEPEVAEAEAAENTAEESVEGEVVAEAAESEEATADEKPAEPLES